MPKLLAAVALLLTLPLFFTGGPDWASSQLYRAAWNLGHIVFFALFTLAIQLHFGAGGWRQFVGISALAFFLGLGIEGLQHFVGRQVDWGDILRNLIGAWLVLAWRRDGLPVWWKWTARVGATALLIVQLGSVADAAVQQAWVTNQSPRLSNLENPRSLRQWQGDLSRSRQYSRNGEYSLALHLGTGRYAGAGLTHLPRDWRGYNHLGFSLYNPGPDTLTLTLRINDLAHDRGSNAYDDRFNSQLAAMPGWNSYRVDLESIRQAPATRTMNMNAIRRLMIFTSGLSAPATVYLDNLRLE